LARSASLGGAPSSTQPSSKPRRHHHQPDDLEGAFNIENQPNQSLSGSRPFTQLPHNSFYPASVGYQHQSLTGTGGVANSAASPSDSYSDMYYNGSSGQSSKRSQASHDPSSSAHDGRSPIRGTNPPSSATLMDYSQQSQYSPTATYSYASPADQRTHPATYHSHSRNHSQVKSESMTPPIASPYTPQTTTLGSAGPYSPSYPMETSSPRPPSHIQTHLSAHVPVRHSSTSNPPTPLSYLHSQSPSLQYYPQEQAMVVDPPPQKRRASGFRRVRTAHDLQPRIDIPPSGRRMGSDGAYLSVCAMHNIAYHIVY
jgi:dual specificity protein kinase YAK1